MYNVISVNNYVMGNKYNFRTIKDEVSSLVKLGNCVNIACAIVAEKYGITASTAKKYYYTKCSPQILQFKAPENALTDVELNNLFAGFLRLIKKTVILQFEKEYRTKINYYVSRLNECMAQLNKKDRQLKALIELNKELVGAKKIDETDKLKEYLNLNKISNNKSG